MSIGECRLYKILYISRGGQIAGAQRQLLYLLEGLDKTKYKPIVISTSRGDFVNEIERLGIEYYIYKFNHWRKLKNIIRRYKDVKYIFGLAVQNNVSLLHCSDMWLNKQVAIVPEKNIESIVSILMRLSKDRNLIKKIGENASVWAQKELSVDKLVRDTEKIYADILSGTPHIEPPKAN